MAEIIREAMYQVVKVIALMVAAFAIGWFMATFYTMGTLQVEIMPDIERIVVVDYLGNSDFHYITPVQRMVIEDEE